MTEPERDTKTAGTTLKSRIKNRLPQSLFGRTMLIIIAPVILLQLTATIVFFDRHWVKMTDRLSDAVAGELALVVGLLNDKNTSLKEKEFQYLQNLVTRRLEITLTYTEGQTLPKIPKQLSQFGLERSLSTALSNRVNRPHNINVDFDNKRIDIWIEMKDGVLHAYMPERRLFSSSGYIFILWMIGLSILFFTISVWLMRNQIRPIHRLASAANRLGRGQDVSYFKPSGASEVRQASVSFLKMRDRIRRQIEQRTAMLAGVSHDLRTPITRLKLQLSMMADMPPTQSDILDMQHDLTEMEGMIDAYLAFAKGQDYEDTEQVDILDILKSLQQKFTQANQNNKTIDITNKAQKTNSYLRPRQINRAFSNLINNAITYGDKLHIVVENDPPLSNIIIKFIDNGPGIAPDELEKVFRPFYRIETSRNKNTGGVGLGLSITQDIIHAHGGKIVLSSENKGLEVKVILPI